MATNPNGPHNNYVGASYTKPGACGCIFCGNSQITTGPTGGATWGCGNNVDSQTLKVKAICSKTNGPHNNVVGAQYHPGPRGCPFCNETNITGSNWACGMTGAQYKVTSICGRLAMLCGPAPAASNGPKLLDPKENRIGNMVLWDGHCPFCRKETIGGMSPCGWQCDPQGNVYAKPVQAKMLEVCKNVSSITSKPAQVAVLEKIIRPTVNCPACGAYCAHKHRIGCKAVVTC